MNNILFQNVLNIVTFKKILLSQSAVNLYFLKIVMLINREISGYVIFRRFTENSILLNFGKPLFCKKCEP